MRVESGVIVGSNNKYQTRNPISRKLIQGFDQSISNCLALANPSTVLEIGCGEGHVTELILAKDVSKVLATDISVSLIKENADRINDPRVNFQTADLFSLPLKDQFDLIVCCEVLEHLSEPEEALDILFKLKANRYIFSVPREPIWRLMNMCRGAYLGEFGNSPGHIQHFSKSTFLKMVKNNFIIDEIMTPLPWTVVLCTPR